MVLYYVVLMNLFNFNSYGIVIIAIPFIYFLKNTFIPMYIKNWTLDSRDFQALKCIGNSIYASFVFIGLSAFF